MYKRLEILDKYPQLKESALLEFSQNCFEEASLNTILKDSGMSKGSFYHNFKDKSELYFAVVEHIAKLKEDNFEKMLMSVNFSSADFFDKIILIAKHNVNLIKGVPYYEGFYKCFIKEKPDFQAKAISQKPLSDINFFVTIFNEAYEKGELSNNYDKGLLFNYIGTFLSSIITSIQPNDTIDDLVQKYEKYIIMLRDGIGSKKE